ncbi:TRAP transporter large permease [Halodesulfovibrio spirochaetisodalis]|uniref:C4-dicarboxylate ABC transporter permease n=1 Tax=Halodesulfovibrio spirochaetisodalis TaxID=1560234 RepID=A0A1B7XC82_9BACT|nr:TRAP transporter large permease [Halodesulfovibrio spirochaetisodalis]OBQ51477.1 C4-dicarboxylate ABC transporter permease [Halodesulfovibrio spirochaetisodalis]
MGVAEVLFLTFLVLMLLGAPITVALGVSAMFSFMVVGQDLSTLIQIAFTSVNSFPIMALPAFVLAGALMECAGVSKRLVIIAENLVGPVRGGLAISTALACVFFGAISGSGPATTAAVGMLMIPAMIKRDYEPGYAAAATATAGGVGIIIPPSIPMVIYGVAAQESITKMFLGGVIPGLLIAAGLIAMHLFKCRKMEVHEDMAGWSAATLFKSMKEGFWAMMAPIVILGGIYSGFFTPTEAAIVAIFYTLFVGFFIYKELTIKSLMKSLETTSWLTGRVLIIMFTAYAFGRLLVQYRIPDQIVEMLLAFTSNVMVVWIFVVLILLFLGMFMETLAIILLVTPVLLPVMKAFGVDPIHFGIVLVCCCGVGFSTPPLGENMFIASGIADVSLEEISAKAIPFCCVTIGVIFLLVMFPQLILFLPKMLM